MILVDVWRFWARQQSMKAVKAALDAEYAAMVAAGTRARWVPVTRSPVGWGLACRWGRNLIIRLTMLVKLTLTSWWNLARSNSRGRDSRVEL